VGKAERADGLWGLATLIESHWKSIQTKPQCVDAPTIRLHMQRGGMSGERSGLYFFLVGCSRSWCRGVGGFLFAFSFGGSRVEVKVEGLVRGYVRWNITARRVRDISTSSVYAD
jgi:hypothetical protein